MKDTDHLSALLQSIDELASVNSRCEQFIRTCNKQRSEFSYMHDMWEDVTVEYELSSNKLPAGYHCR